MALTDLDAAIVTNFTGNATLVSAFPGGLHADAAPEGSAMPYVIYRVLSAPSSTAYGGKNRTQVYVRFTVVGVGKTAMGAKMTTLLAAYDDTLLSLANGVNTFVVGEQDPVPSMFSPRTANADEVWQWVTSIQYGIRY